MGLWPLSWLEAGAYQLSTHLQAIGFQDASAFVLELVAYGSTLPLPYRAEQRGVRPIPLLLSYTR